MIPTVLGPRELSVAAAAYQLALADVSDEEGFWSDFPAHEIRRSLAGAILAEAARGALDPQAIRTAALHHLMQGSAARLASSAPSV